MIKNINTPCNEELSFYKNKKILITGNTGFKGSWMSKVLLDAGACVTGYALEPISTLSLYEMCDIKQHINSIIGDIRDLESLDKVFKLCTPDIVIHMAAQPLVCESYVNPVYTYEVNVMGTVNVLECIRNSESVKSFLNVTTDKVYLNREWEWGYRENEELNGFDPYSNSKSCSELVTSSYRNSYFSNRSIAISTARAGNVIGWGDFSKNRIIPDCINAATSYNDIILRNPHSIRPYQHVLEPVFAYLLILQEQYQDPKYAGSYNVGPDDADCCTTENLVSIFCDKWKQATGNSILYKSISCGGPHEANFLKLDCSKLKNTFGWQPRWNINVAIEKTVDFCVAYKNERNVMDVLTEQINSFLKCQ